MRISWAIKYFSRLLAMNLRTPKRYRKLFKSIYQTKSRKILEIGTFNGKHGKLAIETAKIFHPNQNVEYYGFDLFEELTEKQLRLELSKRPPAYDQVLELLTKTRAKVTLFKGNTIQTLPAYISELPKMDLIFIDGGHSKETIQSDWSHVKKLLHESTIVIFDDYYTDLEEEIKGMGCQELISELNTEEFDVKILNPIDRFKKKWGTLNVQFAQVSLKSSH